MRRSGDGCPNPLDGKADKPVGGPRKTEGVKLSGLSTVGRWAGLVSFSAHRTDPTCDIGSAVCEAIQAGAVEPAGDPTGTV